MQAIALSYDAAHAAPERDTIYPRDSWERAQRDLAALEPVFRRLAERYGVALDLNVGGRYPEPARVLRRQRSHESVRLMLAPRPYGASATDIVGYELGVARRTTPRNPIRRWLEGGTGHWDSTGVFGAEQVAAAAPAVVATLERVAEETFGAGSAAAL